MSNWDGDRYTCPRCDARRRFGDVHSCPGYNEHFVVYLNPGMQPFFLTERRPACDAPPILRRIVEAYRRLFGC